VHVPKETLTNLSCRSPSCPRDVSSGAHRTAIGDCNVVVNLLGRDFETGRYSFHDINVDAAARVARLAADAGVARLVHFSALGASHDAPSKRLRTKAAGEEAVREAFPTATVVRPAPVFGQEDRLLGTWAALSKTIPVGVPLIDGGRTRMAPVEARDVAAAVKAIVWREDTAGKTYTLAGPDVFTVRQLVDLVFRTIRDEPRTVSIPSALAKLLAQPRDILQSMVPFPVPALPAPMYLADGIDSFAADYVAPEGALGFADLGIIPRKLEGLNVDYLRSYRAGGYDFGQTAGTEEGSTANSG
jgi:NADH dehydrogenase (ubiquinone) 1 alpha subcomplex subunit 9